MIDVQLVICKGIGVRGSNHTGAANYSTRQVGGNTIEGNIGAIITRLGFWGIIYYNFNKEPPQ